MIFWVNDRYSLIGKLSSSRAVWKKTWREQDSNPINCTSNSVIIEMSSHLFACATSGQKDFYFQLREFSTLTSSHWLLCRLSLRGSEVLHSLVTLLLMTCLWWMEYAWVKFVYFLWLKEYIQDNVLGLKEFKFPSLWPFSHYSLLAVSGNCPIRGVVNRRKWKVRIL